MGLFKHRNTTKKRLAALESYLGLVYAQDEYGDFEHFEKNYGELKDVKRRLDRLEEGKKK